MHLRSTDENRLKGPVDRIRSVREPGLQLSFGGYAVGEVELFGKLQLLNWLRLGVGTVLLGEGHLIREGDQVKRTGRIISVPVGEELVGRVVNSLGQPVDGKGPIVTKQFSPIERIAPGVVDRSPVKEPL